MINISLSSLELRIYLLLSIWIYDELLISKHHLIIDIDRIHVCDWEYLELHGSNLFGEIKISQKNVEEGGKG